MHLQFVVWIKLVSDAELNAVKTVRTECLHDFPYRNVIVAELSCVHVGVLIVNRKNGI